MRRTVIPELLDSDSGTGAEVAQSLRDLQRINRWFGGVTTTEALVRAVLHETGTESFDILDVASGSGDIPNAVTHRLIGHGIRLRYTALDRAKSHVQSHGRAVVGDALALPFSAGSFDLVSCALFAHHLEPEEVVTFVKEGLRVARIAVLINDLIRSPIHLALIYAGQPLFRSHITRHDSVASLKRSYTVSEMMRMVEAAGARKVEFSRHYMYRMGVIAWR